MKKGKQKKTGWKPKHTNIPYFVFYIGIPKKKNQRGAKRA